MKHPTPKPFMLQIVYDIKSWISDHAEELHEHTVPKCFKFELNDEWKAIMHYRNLSREQWQGPIVILKVCTSFFVCFHCFLLFTVVETKESVQSFKLLTKIYLRNLTGLKRKIEICSLNAVYLVCKII